MFDRDDVNAPIRLVDSVDDTEVPATGTVKSGEIELQGLADPLRILRQGAVAELDDCGTDLVSLVWVLAALSESVDGSRPVRIETSAVG